LFDRPKPTAGCSASGRRKKKKLLPKFEFTKLKIIGFIFTAIGISDFLE
jgi:hypothetical protein